MYSPGALHNFCLINTFPLSAYCLPLASSLTDLKYTFSVDLSIGEIWTSVTRDDELASSGDTEQHAQMLREVTIQASVQRDVTFYRPPVKARFTSLLNCSALKGLSIWATLVSERNFSVSALIISPVMKTTLRANDLATFWILPYNSTPLMPGILISNRIRPYRSSLTIRRISSALSTLSPRLTLASVILKLLARHQLPLSMFYSLLRSWFRWLGLRQSGGSGNYG